MIELLWCALVIASAVVAYFALAHPGTPARTLDSLERTAGGLFVLAVALALAVILAPSSSAPPAAARGSLVTVAAPL